MTFEDELELEKQLEIGHTLFNDLLHCLDDINIHGYAEGIQGLLLLLLLIYLKDFPRLKRLKGLFNDWLTRQDKRCLTFDYYMVDLLNDR